MATMGTAIITTTAMAPTAATTALMTTQAHRATLAMRPGSLGGVWCVHTSTSSTPDHNTPCSAPCMPVCTRKHHMHASLAITHLSSSSYLRFFFFFTPLASTPLCNSNSMLHKCAPQPHQVSSPRFCLYMRRTHNSHFKSSWPRNPPSTTHTSYHQGIGFLHHLTLVIVMAMVPPYAKLGQTWQWP